MRKSWGFLPLCSMSASMSVSMSTSMSAAPFFLSWMPQPHPVPSTSKQICSFSFYISCLCLPWTRITGMLPPCPSFYEVAGNPNSSLYVGELFPQPCFALPCLGSSLSFLSQAALRQEILFLSPICSLSTFSSPSILLPRGLSWLRRLETIFKLILFLLELTNPRTDAFSVHITVPKTPSHCLSFLHLKWADLAGGNGLLVVAVDFLF